MEKSNQLTELIIELAEKKNLSNKMAKNYYNQWEKEHITECLANAAWYDGRANGLEVAIKEIVVIPLGQPKKRPEIITCPKQICNLIWMNIVSALAFALLELLSWSAWSWLLVHLSG